MNIINIQAAKTHLSRLVEQAAAGEEIILAKAGKPLVKLIPFQREKNPRVGGQLQGQIWEAADCWEPEEDDLLATGESLFPVESATTAARLLAEAKPKSKKK